MQKRIKQGSTRALPIQMQMLAATNQTEQWTPMDELGEGLKEVKGFATP
jgi:phage-related protein